MMFVVSEHADFIERIKSLEGVQSIGYTFAVHVILSIRRKEFIDMIESIEAAVKKRKLAPL